MYKKKTSKWKKQLTFVFLGRRWDNRLDKHNPKAPDFVRKTGKHALWLSSRGTPEWVLDALPPPW